jgi:hypothetical protein
MKNTRFLCTLSGFDWSQSSHNVILYITIEKMPFVVNKNPDVVVIDNNNSLSSLNSKVLTLSR